MMIVGEAGMRFNTNIKSETLMHETYVTTKGQSVIPSSIRRKLGIIEGTRIQIEVDEKENRIILTPVTRARMQKLLGLYKGTNLLGALAQDKATEKGR